ncbi:MAG: response regulator [Candidatus Cloacimonadales bacterium]|jgi:DNA-binding response OmpR family regulator|nr:response regulator [Candidatus Cloacimonadota bacterium]MDD2650690.1 response regulator [Candidatus Cloacimonadota bacterium]MDD3501403.1 response regulator [Candidatus Cloacimonadota bacterium]MDX9976947.1 response regulator [Candidatus Cloacimonadales bacterium]
MENIVLLIEDDETLCELVAEMFNLLKTPLLTAYTMNEAVQIFEENQDKIALAIFDMNLDESSGIDVYEALKEKGKDFVAILASGMFLEDDKDTYIEMGFTEIIAKPFSLADIRRIISTYL